mgnify:CR=1 FL=1
MAYNENPDYDPDSPPANSGFDKLIQLVQSVRVDTLAEASAFNDPDISSAYEFFTTGEYAHDDGSPCWILVFKSVDAVRADDGQPLTYTERLALKTRGGDKWLGAGQAPDKLAQQFMSLGVSASWNKAGQPDSAIGRVFHAQTQHEVKLFKRRGESISKTFRVWPTAVEPADFIYAGEIRSVASKTDGEAPDSPSVPIPNSYTTADVLAHLVDTKANDVANTLIDAQVPGIVEGLPILDIAFSKGAEGLAEVLPIFVGADGLIHQRPTQ